MKKDYRTSADIVINSKKKNIEIITESRFSINIRKCREFRR